MSDYHIRGISRDGRKANVIFHIPIPIENNSVGTSLRVAVQEKFKPRNADGTFGVMQSALQGIDSVELTKLQAGEFFEHIENVNFKAADNTGQKQSTVDARFNQLKTTIVNRARVELKFWGLNRDVV